LHSKIMATDESGIGLVETNNNGFVMSAAYNVDMSTYNFIETTQFDGLPYNWELDDETFAELIEKMWAQDVKVVSAPFSYYVLSDYYPHSSLEHDGVSNVYSYLASQCADHDLVWCNSAGNNVATRVPMNQGNGGSGFIPWMADARNILACAFKRTQVINDITYEVSVRNYYKKVDDSGNVFYRSSAAAGYTQREVLPYHGYGETPDGRIKPDILAIYNKDFDLLPLNGPCEYAGEFIPSFSGGINNFEYIPVLGSYSSFVCPKIAAGVALLREALPKLDAHQIRECVMLSASHGTAPVTTGAGYGLINLAAALAYGQARPSVPPPSFEAGNWFPKSVQSAKFVADPSGNEEYQAAYAEYETAYNAYVASSPTVDVSGNRVLWSGAVLDESPVGPPSFDGFRAMNVDGSFDVKKAKSWIFCAQADMEELKNLMTTNGIKVGYTSKALSAFVVTADSVDQLKAVVNGNEHIRNIQPSLRLKVVNEWGSNGEDEE